MSYGVVPTGFSRKPLPVILQELEEAMIATFGPAVIQSAQSPLGQINGLMANLSAQSWELGEDVYQSLDPDVAEGARLDVLGRIRLVERPADESDVNYRRRITNEGRAKLALRALVETIEAVDGVSCVSVRENCKPFGDANCVPAHSIAVGVIGGDDVDVAEAILAETVPGIGLYGNTTIEAVDATGYCRTVSFIRPVAVPIKLRVMLASAPAHCACRAPSVSEVRSAVASALACSSDCGLRNGDPVTDSSVRRALLALPGAEVLSILGSRDGTSNYKSLPLGIGLFEIATIDPAEIEVVYG